MRMTSAISPCLTWLLTASFAAATWSVFEYVTSRLLPRAMVIQRKHSGQCSSSWRSPRERLLPPGWRRLSFEVISISSRAGWRVLPMFPLVNTWGSFHHWIEAAGLHSSAYGTHSMRRTKATLIYKRTKNLRAVQLLLGHTKLARKHRPVSRNRGRRRARDLGANRDLVAPTGGRKGHSSSPLSSFMSSEYSRPGAVYQ